MPTPDLPPTDPRAGDIARQKMILTVVIGFIALAALIFVVAARQLPLPLRLLIAGSDLVVAAVLWLVIRQKFSGK
jgi:hypothetical protein